MVDGELKIKELGPRFKLVREHFEWQGVLGYDGCYDSGICPLTSTGFSCKDSEKVQKAKENDVVFTRKYRETLIKH